MQLSTLLQVTAGPTPAAAGRGAASTAGGSAAAGADDGGSGFARELGLASAGGLEADDAPATAAHPAARKGAAARDAQDPNALLLPSVGCRAAPEGDAGAEGTDGPEEPLFIDGTEDTTAVPAADAGPTPLAQWLERVAAYAPTTAAPAAHADTARAAAEAATVANTAAGVPSPALTPAAVAAPHARATGRRGAGSGDASLALADAAGAAGSRRGERKDRPADGAARESTASTDARPQNLRAEIAPLPDDADAPSTATRDARPDDKPLAMPLRDDASSRDLRTAGEGVRSELPAAIAPVAGGTDAIAPLAAAGPAAAAPTAGTAAAPAEVRLPVPITQPEFAPVFGAEISVLARDGVQEARVHVNPAEMGPIAVQITLDGQQAQVSLVADNALTRQLLEQSMPTLAAALRENGLTLTGGGVFEQPRQRDAEAAQGSGSGSGQGGQGGDSGGRDRRHDDAGDSGDPTRAAPRALRRQGVLDVYA